MPWKGEAGFTFPEMLVVLLVVSVMTALAFPGFGPVKDAVAKNMLINQLERDLYFAQADAIARQTNVYIKFYQPNNTYTIYESRQNAFLAKRKLPDDVKMLSNGSTLSSCMIGPDGNVSQFGTLYFQAGGNKIKLVTYIGSGRFYVEE